MNKCKIKFFLYLIFFIVLFPPIKVNATNTDIYFNKSDSEFVFDNANILSNELKNKINNNSTLISEELDINIIFISVLNEIPINKIDYSKNLVNYWGLSNTSTILVGFYPYSIKEPIQIYNTKYIEISDNEKMLFEEELYNHLEDNSLDPFITNMYKSLLRDDIKKENKIFNIFNNFKIKKDSIFHDFKLGLSNLFLPDINVISNRLKNSLYIFKL